MITFNFEEKAYALGLAADSLTYAWESTVDEERADAIELGVPAEHFEWYAQGYLAARDELRVLSELMTAHAEGKLETREVNGL